MAGSREEIRTLSRRLGWTGPAIVALGYTVVLAGGSIGGVNQEQVASVGVIILGLGVLCMISGILVIFRRWWSERAWYQETEEGKIDSFHRVDGPGQLPRPGDVELVIGLATKRIDPELFYSPEQLREYLKVNPGALRVLRNDREDPQRLTGYYVLLGLTERAEMLIRDGAIDAGVAVAPRLTVHDPGKAAALYLGMVQGFGRQGRAGAVMSLIDHILGIVAERGGREVSVFARRGNSSSSSLMDWLDFKPVKTGGGIEEALAPNPAIILVKARMKERLP